MRIENHPEESDTNLRKQESDRNSDFRENIMTKNNATC